jgi:hypothetical protein
MLHPDNARKKWEDLVSAHKGPPIRCSETRWFMGATQITTVGAFCALTQAEFHRLYKDAVIAECEASVARAHIAVEQASDPRSRRTAGVGLGAAQRTLTRAQHGQLSNRNRDDAWRDIQDLQDWSKTADTAVAETLQNCISKSTP